MVPLLGRWRSNLYDMGTVFRRLLAVVVVTVSIVAVADEKKGGYWCWQHPDGSVAACAPLEEQCAASLEGFNRTAEALREPRITAACKWQKTAWQLIMKPPRSPRTRRPSKRCAPCAASASVACPWFTTTSSSA
jgi:hypothetical protein